MEEWRGPKQGQAAYIMDNQIKKALSKGHLIDITTIGRKTGQAHRKEIAFHNINGRIYISGLPGPRGWYANLLSNPELHVPPERKSSRRLTSQGDPHKGPGSAPRNPHRSCAHMKSGRPA